MVINYTWNITQLECYPQTAGQTNVVCKAEWSLSGSYEAYTNTLTGVASFVYDGTSSYTPYDQLTEAQVIQWTQSSLGEQFVAEAEHSIAENIQAAMSSAPVTPPLPWG